MQLHTLTLMRGFAGDAELALAVSAYGEVFRMAATFREMVRTRREPIPHEEIVAVTAIVHAGAKSAKEKSRLVALAEVE